MRDFLEVLREASRFGLSRKEQLTAYHNHYSAGALAEVRERAIAAGQAIECRERGTGGRAAIRCYAVDHAPPESAPAPRPRRPAKLHAPAAVGNELDPSARYLPEVVLPAKPRLEPVGVPPADRDETHQGMTIYEHLAQARRQSRASDAAIIRELGLAEELPQPLPIEDTTTPERLEGSQ